MAKYQKIMLNDEGVEALEKMARDMQEIYDSYADAGNKLIQEFEVYRDAIGTDAPMIEELVMRLNDELTLNSAEIINMYEYCKRRASEISNKLQKRI